MNVNKKLNIEGATYVIPGEETFNEAEVKSAREGDWNDFQTVSEDEATYAPKTNLTPAEEAKILERAKAIRYPKFGAGILSVFNRAA